MNPDLAAAMKRAGIYQAIMNCGHELDRVKAFLNSLADGADRSSGLQAPEMPCFPGLESSPFLSPQKSVAVEMLESGYAEIAAEANRLKEADYLTYYPRGKPNDPGRSVETTVGSWKIFVFRYMASKVRSSISLCPRTYDMIRRLPGFCADYPWGDALFSLHLPGTHLPPHCSVDNLRVRIHLGLDIPAGSKIRVGDEHRAWQQGKCLLFDDSFEHETWNHSSRHRLILIVDLWHPNLTPIEQRALIAAFNCLPVKQLIFMRRLKNTDAGQALIQDLERQAVELDAASRREFEANRTRSARARKISTAQSPR